MTNQPRQASLAAWVLAPKRALARETGLDRRGAGRLIAQSRRRFRPRVIAVAAIQIATMAGWVLLIDRYVGIYETTTTFAPDGSMLTETTTGPFGTTTLPLFFGVLLGPFTALVLGAFAGLASHFWLVDREARRCARTPACFNCGYDLSAVVGHTCPECGRDQPHLARIVTP
ncbi:MAG: hypothetical protein ACIAQU_07380 [Phycisphaerales bacterium JB064]